MAKNAPQVVNAATMPGRRGSPHPVAVAAKCKARYKQPLGDAFGLSQFGVNRATLPPGTWSTVRHWHTAEDEFVIVLSGELVLVTDGGESVMRPGDCAGFKAGDANAHRLENRGGDDAVYLEVGSRRADDVTYYPDEDLIAKYGARGEPRFFRRSDGKPIN
jgi:uncharacterized cupin superfamily protein